MDRPAIVDRRDVAGGAFLLLTGHLGDTLMELVQHRLNRWSEDFAGAAHR
jgi:hypothetical protein